MSKMHKIHIFYFTGLFTAQSKADTTSFLATEFSIFLKDLSYIAGNWREASYF